MRRLASCIALVCLVVSLALLRAQAPAKAITIEGDHFNVDGVPTFLIFVSYFDALRATPATWATDLGYLSSHGIHGVRIFASWSDYCGGTPPPPANDGVIRTGGNVDATMLNKLKDFLTTARSYGMVVDVTFDRDAVTGGMTIGQYQNAVQYVVGQIASYPNAIVDVQNEYDNAPTHIFSDSEIGSLIAAVHTGDPARRAAGSLGASPGGAAAAGSIAVTYGHDFSAMHDARTSTWYQSSDISTLISNLKSGLGGVSKPIYFQEPTPWASNPCGASGSGDTNASHFTTAIAAAKANGAAAWTFHTRVGFELTSASLLSRLNADPNQKATLESMSASQGSSWGVSAFSVSPANTNVNELAGSGTLTLTRLAGSTGNWQATSNVGWLQPTSQGSGGSLGFTYSANKSTQSRVGTITVSGRSVTVTQAAGQLYGAIESPGNGATLGRPFTVSGWAIDTAAASGIGVSVVHIYAAANAGAGALTFLGAVVPSTSRPAVAAAFGAQYQNSGYELSVGALAPGTYQLQAYPFRVATSTFGAPQTSLLTIRHVPADFDGDFASDITVYRPSTGGWWVLKSSGGLNDQDNYNRVWGLSGDIPIAGDFDGDGKADMTVYRPSTGGWYVLKSSGNFDLQNYIYRVWGVPGDIPIAGDFDGDGITDMTVYRPSTGYWYVLKSSGAFDLQSYIYHLWGISGDKPITGDFDGDGKSDMTVFRPSTGEWWILKSSGNLDDQQNIHHVWGLSTDIPLVGDFDGDGKSDMTILRPSTGEWYVLKSSGNLNDQDNYHVTWAVSGDIPIVGDYDGDGRSDMAVYRPSTGEWIILKSSGSFYIVNYIYHLWGIGGDLPVYQTPN